MTGCSFIIWHQEFTIGTGKKCPFNVVMSRTNELITAVKAFLRKYQVEGTTVPPVTTTPPPVTIPEPKYANPAPVAQLVFDGDLLYAGRKAFEDINGSRWRLVSDKVRVTKIKEGDDDNFYHQYAGHEFEPTKPNPKIGDIIDAVYMVTNADGEEWYSDNQWARFPVLWTELVED